jgi:hypothetical protein
MVVISNALWVLTAVPPPTAGPGRIDCAMNVRKFSDPAYDYRGQVKENFAGDE